MFVILCTYVGDHLQNETAFDDRDGSTCVQSNVQSIDAQLYEKHQVVHRGLPILVY
jgi:hypothetical protein